MFTRQGGKSKLKKAIIQIMPEHTIYVEPFVGAGHVFFEKEPAEVNVINDLDKDIYHIFIDTQKVGDKMINYDFTNDRATFNKLKTQTKFNKIEDRLYRNLYLSRNSFGGNRKNFGVEKKKSVINTGQNFKTDKWKNKLKGVKIFNKDFKDIIKKYDSKDTLFYLDPPYSTSVNDYAVGGVDPQEIYNALQGLKGKFILSYDYTPEIKKMFKKYNISTIKTKYIFAADDNNRLVKEYLITNFIY